MHVELAVGAVVHGACDRAVREELGNRVWAVVDVVAVGSAIVLRAARAVSQDSEIPRYANQSRSGISFNQDFQEASILAIESVFNSLFN